MTTGTAFALASVSKTLTAGVVLQLVEEGKLSLDERVAPLLPAYDLDRRITVRELLDHTSGIPDYFLNAKIDRPLQADKAASWAPEQTWTYVAPPQKRYRPDRVWLYSNANYLLLGELVEAVTGRPLAREIRDRILDPLAMESSWYQAVERPRAEGTLGYRLLPATGGGLRAVPVAKLTGVMPFRSVVTAAAGAGSIAATALDAARWMRAYAGGDLLGPEVQREMLADVAHTKALNAAIPYGLGIQALPIEGRRALGHSGRFLGFRNVVRYLPDEGVTIAVLTNQGVRDPARIAGGLLRLILPPLPGPEGSAAPSSSP
jgi:D-alanyl-D-alanine carboxypeptidase